jgi:non-ribosomal peptide synthetase component F
VRSYRGSVERFELDQELSEKLRALSQRESVTLFMLLLAVFKVLLLKYAGQQDIVIGADVANRNRAETENLIGFFVNLLVLRTDLSGNPTFRELLHRVREVCLEAYAHQDRPFEKLVEELQPERSLSYAPFK